MKRTLIILNIVALIAALAWLMKDLSLEPFITSIGLIGSLITLIYASNQDSGVKMKQKGGKKSNNYQASGNININSRNDKR